MEREGRHKGDRGVKKTERANQVFMVMLMYDLKGHTEMGKGKEESEKR